MEGLTEKGGNWQGSRKQVKEGNSRGKFLCTIIGFTMQDAHPPSTSFFSFTTVPSLKDTIVVQIEVEESGVF